MDLAPLGSEMSTNSLLELLTVYTTVPARVFATWSELRLAVVAVCFGCDAEPKGSDGARWSPLGGGRLPPRNRVVSLIRVENSAPRRRQ